MTYCVKQGNTKICSGTASTITVTNVAANETSVSICWIGIITEETNCQPCETEQTFCELIYIGENTSTASTAHTGNIVWHDITIPYSITQKGNTVEPDCESATTTSCITDSYNVWVSPYIVTKEEGGHDIKFYADYSVATIDACGNVINIEKITSSGCPISDSEGLSAKTDFEEAIANKECTDTDRTISAACRLMDIVPCLTSDSAKTVSATCYLQEEEHCCENESGICYEIGEITYSPTSVPFSGGDVYYSFDYKKKTTVNCVTSTKVGTYTSSRPWHISGRTDTTKEEGGCQRKQVTSSFTPSLDDFITCTRPSSSLTLSIWQGKNTENPECDEVTCEGCMGYIIDGASIGQSAYTSDGTWERIGTSAATHTFPSYGGQLRVEWKYSAITRYDDCSYSITSGNTWTDIKQISPCDECYNAGESEVTDPIAIEYTFKNGTAKCFPDVPALSADCNTFTINYKQQKSPCVQDCPSCMGDGAITLDCGYSASTDELTGEVIYGDYISGITAVSSQTHCNVVSAITDTICDWLLINKSGDYYVYSANTANSGSSRTCVVSFDLGKIGNVPCTESVIVTQLGSGAERDDSGGEAPIICPCKYADGLYVGAYSLGVISYKGGNPLDVASFGYGECVSSFTLDMKESVDWFTETGITSSSTVDEQGNIVDVEGALSGSVDCNCDCENDRSFEIEYTYAASGCSGESGTTIITQSKNTNCNCNKITALTAGNISSCGGNDITIGTYKLSVDCPPTAATVESTTASFISNVRLSNTSPKLGNGNVIADVSSNYCSSSDRSGDITITYEIGNKTCTASFVATQKAGASATLTASSDIPSTGGTVTLASYDIAGETPTTITASKDKDFITAIGINSANKTITGTVDTNYCNNTSRGATITLTYGNGSCSCSKTCNVTQVAGTSAVLSPSGEINCTGGNNITLATYVIIGDDSPTISVTSSDSTNFNITSYASGIIKGTVTENCCNETSRDCTITLTYSKGSSSCTKTCTVTQKGSANDKEIICTDDNYSETNCPDINSASGGTLYLKLKNK